MQIILAPWGYINKSPICDISIAIAVYISGPVCNVKLPRW
jgi:hypothetical protein